MIEEFSVHTNSRYCVHEMHKQYTYLFLPTLPRRILRQCRSDQHTVALVWMIAEENPHKQMVFPFLLHFFCEKFTSFLLNFKILKGIASREVVLLGEWKVCKLSMHEKHNKMWTCGVEMPKKWMDWPMQCIWIENWNLYFWVGGIKGDRRIDIESGKYTRTDRNMDTVLSCCGFNKFM